MPQARPIHISGYARQADDFYATPAWVTEALLRHVRPRGTVWEPCCGNGAMSVVLARNGHRVVSTDIANRGFGTPGIDIFACKAMPEDCRALITNPPYGDTGASEQQARAAAGMLDFVRHALGLVRAVEGQLALLVRLQWIAGKRAAALLSSGPFTAVIALTKRIKWFDMGDQTRTAQHHHAWIVFDFQAAAGAPPSLLFAGRRPDQPTLKLDFP